MQFILIFVVIIVSFILLLKYLGKKMENVFICKCKKKYWTYYWLVTIIFILSNFLKSYLTLENPLARGVMIFQAFYVGIVLYSSLLFLLADIIRFILNKSTSKEFAKLKKVYFRGLSVIIIAVIITSYGIWNANHKVVTTYEVSIDKKASNLDSLNIVMISDTHLGTGANEEGVTKLVNNINELNPDIVLLAGDIFDEGTYESLKEYTEKSFRDINAKYGTFYITGNHDYSSEASLQVLAYMQNGNVTPLEDDVVKIEDSFYIAGRMDPSYIRRAIGQSKSLDEILEGVDYSLPIILLDHVPNRVDEAKDLGVDLQLSGHTHGGQVFPGSIITSLVFKEDNGYLKEEDYNLIVSSGYGTWGFPLKVGSKSEIVNIKVNFN